MTKRIGKIAVVFAFSLVVAAGAVIVMLASAAGRLHGFCKGLKTRLSHG